MEASPDELFVTAAAAPEAVHANLDAFTIADLPAGTAFGSAVHEIFERIEVVPGADAKALEASVRGVVAEVATSPFLRPHHDALAAMIAKAIRTPFGGPHSFAEPD